MADRLHDLYPDGLVVIPAEDLEGVAGTRTGPGKRADGTYALLRLLGVAVSSIPASDDGQAALFRALLDARRLLVVVDGAAEPGDVPSLGPDSSSGLIITSRQEDGPDGLRVPLAGLPEADSVRLLASRAGIPPRGQEEDLRRLADACGRYPVTLAVAGQMLRARPELKPGDLIARMASAGEPEIGPEAGWAVERACELLDDPARAVISALSVLPQSGAAAACAAAALGLAAAEALRHLDFLADLSLVLVVRGRYVVHDLVRLHALRQLEGEGKRAAARARIWAWYQQAAESASRTFAAGSGAASVPPSARSAAVRFLADERVSLVQAVQDAAEAGGYEFVWAVTDALYEPCLRRGLWPEMLAILEAARMSAQLSDRPFLVARLLRSLGVVHRTKNSFAAAIACFEEGAALVQEQEQDALRGSMLTNLGEAYRLAGNLDQARMCYQEARMLARAQGPCDLADEVLAGEANLARDAGHSDEAAQAYAMVLRSARDDHQRALTLMNLGVLHESQAQFRDAARCYRQSLTGFDGAGDLVMKARLMHSLGVCLAALNDRYGARTILQGGLSTARETGNSQAVWEITRTRGILDEEQGEHVAALSWFEQALAVAPQLEDLALPAEFEACCLIARTQQSVGAIEMALASWRSARAAAQLADNLEGVGVALTGAAQLQATTGRTAEAIALFEEAAAISRDRSDIAAEITALENLADLYQRAGSARDADVARQSAAMLCQRLGDRGAQR